MGTYRALAQAGGIRAEPQCIAATPLEHPRKQRFAPGNAHVHHTGDTQEELLRTPAGQHTDIHVLLVACCLELLLY